MTPRDRIAADGRFDRHLGAVFQVGVAAAGAILALGIVLSFVHHPSYLTSVSDLASLAQPGRSPSTFSSVGAGLLAGRGRAVALLGLGILVVTPVLGIALALLRFAREREWRLVLVCLALLVMLALSVVLGRA